MLGENGSWFLGHDGIVADADHETAQLRNDLRNCGRYASGSSSLIASR